MNEDELIVFDPYGVLKAFAEEIEKAKEDEQSN